MQTKPLNQDLYKYLTKRNLKKKFIKQLNIFLENPSYPSLKTEVLEPKDLKIYSFRIDKKYRAIFIFIKSDLIEIIDINDHYK